MSGAPAIVTVHAVDLAGEDGIVTDAGAFDELGCRGIPAVTGITVSGDEGVSLLDAFGPGALRRQLEAAASVGRAAVVRTGILVHREQVEVLADWLRQVPPVALVAAPFTRFAGWESEGRAVLSEVRRSLFPVARVVVLRAADAKALTAVEPAGIDSLRGIASALRDQGARAVLVAGTFERGRVIDFLDDEGRESLCDAARIAAPRVGGLSGAHVAALAAHLARGSALADAMDAAQRYVALRLQRGR